MLAMGRMDRREEKLGSKRLVRRFSRGTQVRYDKGPD